MSKKLFRSGVLLLVVVLLVSTFMVSADGVYPLKSKGKLMYWMELHSNTAQIVKNFGDTVLAKEWAKRTGVNCSYLHPAAGQAREAFNLLLASGDLPDVMEYAWHGIPGGPNSAIMNGSIIRLNKVFDRYAPNLKNYLKANPDMDRRIKTDENNYYVFPFIRKGDLLEVTAGIVIRQDWLDDLGLAAPETIDEWYTVLKAFKEQKGASAPLSLRSVQLNAFSGGFDVCLDNSGFYQENGKVKYSPIEPATKNFYATFNKWFKEGLFDNNFATLDSKGQDANILGGKCGATYGSGGSGLGRWMTAAPDSKYNLGGTVYPAPKKGTLAKFASRSPAYGLANQGSAAVTTKCKNIEAAARLLDYNYSPEGNRLMNFGIEGVSYKMINGTPTYTELIMRNPDGLAITQAMSKYLRGHTNGPFVQDPGYIEQYYELPSQKQGQKMWLKNDYLKYMIPPVNPTVDESNQLSKLLGDINTYQNEMMLKFIMGAEPLSNFDKYVAQLNRLGVAKACAIQQKALDRFNKRN